MKRITILLRALIILILLSSCAPTPLTVEDIPGAIGPSTFSDIQAQRILWLPDDSAIIVGTDTTILWLDPINLKEVYRLDLGEPVEGLLAIPGSSQLLVLVDPARALVVNLLQREISQSPSSWREITNFCPPGENLDVVNFQNAYCGDDSLLGEVKAANKKWQKAIRGGGTIERISPDGKIWALGLGGISEATTWLIDLQSLELRSKLIAGSGTIISVNGALALAISPDSKTLAMADLSGLITLWDTNTGNLLETFAAGKLAVDLAFSPDGRRLAMTGENQILLFERPTVID